MKTKEYSPTEKDLLQCPHGHPKSEIELGSDQSSFMAIVGVPYKYIRCGVCLFPEDNWKPRLDLKEAVDDWNASVRNEGLHENLSNS